jgi:FHS family L-fucose permease-like MFS transporter
MFSAIFTLAIDGLGKHTGQASGILCMAIVGGAVVPVLQGGLADNFWMQLAFFLPVLCYASVAFFGLKDHLPTF